MNSIRRWHSLIPRVVHETHAKMNVARIAALVAALAVGAAVWFALGDGVSAFSEGRAAAQAAAQAQQGSDPEANLPYLFAVYIITWAAFFAYVFYVSRRQREMQAEIDALKRALEERKPSD